MLWRIFSGEFADHRGFRGQQAPLSHGHTHVEYWTGICPGRRLIGTFDFPLTCETWESLFESQGMKNPTPRIRMLDGFNEGRIRPGLEREKSR